MRSLAPELSAVLPLRRTPPDGRAQAGVGVAMTAPGAIISDHAVLRYLERAYGLDVAAIRAEIASARRPAIEFGAPVVITHGVRLVLREGLYCVTALPRKRARGRGR